MQTTKRSLKTLILTATVLGTLGGCTTAVIGGTAAGVASAMDRRSSGAQADDQIMEVRVKNVAMSNIRRINPNPPFRPKIIVVSHNRHILLLGQVPNESDKQAAEQAARAEKNALAVYNYIEVTAGGRTFNESGNDKWITSKVRGNLIATPGTYSGINVTTYNGVVYVMGILTPEQQEAVTRRVSTTPGVQRVVTLYETYN